MTYGLQVRNSSGDLVIDDAFANHVLAESGSVDVDRYGLWFDAYAARVALATPVPLARCPLVWGRTAVAGRYCGLAGYEINGSGQLAAFYVVSWTGDPHPTTVQWRVTATPVSPGPDSHGLRVWGPDGTTLVFDSGLPYLRIADVPAAFDPTDTGDVLTHGAMAAPYYCLSALAYLRTTSPSGDDTEWQAAMAARQSDTTTRVALMPYAYQGGDTLYSAIGGGFQEVRLVLAHP